MVWGYNMDAISQYMSTSYKNSASSAAANQATKSISGLSKDSSREEVTEAVKGFESYFMEQVLKEVKKSMTLDDDKDNDPSMQMYKDNAMDQVISLISKDLVDKIGDGGITDDFVDQIMRNYGITEEGTEELAAEGAEAGDGNAMTSAGVMASGGMMASGGAGKMPTDDNLAETSFYADSAVKI